MADFPVFTATPEGAESVVRRARRRRQAKVGGGLGSVAIVTALVFGTVVVRGPAPSPDQLTVLDTPTPTVTPLPTATTVQQPRGVASVVPAQPDARSTTGPAPADAPDPVITAPPRTRARRISPITRGTRTDSSLTDLCDSGQGDPTTWCVRIIDPGPVKRGQPVVLTAELCRLRPARSGTITFDSTREVYLRVLEGDKEDWAAGEGITYRKPGRTVTVAGGECLTWSATWDTRDRNGFVAPPGTYDLEMDVAAGETYYSVSLSVSVVD